MRNWVDLEGAERARILKIRDQQEANLKQRIADCPPGVTIPYRTPWPLWDFDTEKGTSTIYSNTQSYRFDSVPYTIETFTDGVTSEKVTKHIKTCCITAWLRRRKQS